MVNLKNMSKKEKFEYVWDYYKVHIIVGVIALLLIISFIHGQVTKTEYVFNLTVVEKGMKEDKRIELENKLTSLVVNPSDKRKRAMVDVISADGDYQQTQKFYTKLAANEIDIVILDRDTFDNLAKKNGFLKLDNIDNFRLSDIKNNKIESEANGDNKAVYGISAEGIKLLEEGGIDTSNKVVSIISSSLHKEKAIIVLNWLLKN